VRGSDGKIDSASLPATSGGGATALSGLTDVALTSPSSTQVLQYNGSKWINSSLAGVALTLNDLTNVNTTGAVNGSILKFNGTNWVVGSDLQASGGTGSVAWGAITGTVANQTDLVSYISGRNWPISAITNLQTTLNSKLDLAGLKAVDGSGSGIDSDLLDGQHGSYYLNYANFTGTPPTAGSAITASSYAANGYVKIGTFIIQWGKVFVSDSTTTVYQTLPIAFPTACLTAVGHPSVTIDGGDESDETIYVRPYSSSQIAISTDGDFSSVYVYYIAMGY
jgi:hypothetical protein